MNHPARALFFRHYWWIALLVGFIGSVSIFQFAKSENAAVAVPTFCAAVFSAAFLVQKQKVDDLILFERLFTQFNTRYAVMHESLSRVLREADWPREREVFDGYFNLCAEEYLFFQQGRILPEVWQAWAKGMMKVLDNSRAAAYWNEEQKLGSHYGLTMAVILKGAGF